MKWRSASSVVIHDKRYPSSLIIVIWNWVLGSKKSQQNDKIHIVNTRMTYKTVREMYALKETAEVSSYVGQSNETPLRRLRQDSG